mmetsp:Transcript_45973/g.139578  ORF Transcript_45973/g.139578 Transcript_45973/m.139578 type:complete len:1236 (-) Transcript_45973:170-3877(-)
MSPKTFWAKRRSMSAADFTQTKGVTTTGVALSSSGDRTDDEWLAVKANARSMFASGSGGGSGGRGSGSGGVEDVRAGPRVGAGADADSGVQVGGERHMRRRSNEGGRQQQGLQQHRRRRPRAASNPPAIYSRRTLLDDRAAQAEAQTEKDQGQHQEQRPRRSSRERQMPQQRRLTRELQDQAAAQRPEQQRGNGGNKTGGGSDKRPVRAKQRGQQRTSPIRGGGRGRPRKQQSGVQRVQRKIALDFKGGAEKPSAVIEREMVMLMAGSERKRDGGGYPRNREGSRDRDQEGHRGDRGQDWERDPDRDRERDNIGEGQERNFRQSDYRKQASSPPPPSLDRPSERRSDREGHRRRNEDCRRGTRNDPCEGVNVGGDQMDVPWRTSSSSNEEPSDYLENDDDDGTKHIQGEDGDDEEDEVDAAEDELTALTKPQTVLVRQPSFSTVMSPMIWSTATGWQEDQIHSAGQVDTAEECANLAEKDRYFEAGNKALADEDYDEAKVCFRKSLHRLNKKKERKRDISDSTGSSDDIGSMDESQELSISLAHERLGDTHLKLGEMQEAHGHYQLALGIIERRLGDTETSFLRIMMSMGDLYFKSGIVRHALKYYERGLKLRLEGRKMNEDHPDVAFAARKLAHAHEALALKEIEEDNHDMAFFHYREVLWLARLLPRERIQRGGYPEIAQLMNRGNAIGKKGFGGRDASKRSIPKEIGRLGAGREEEEIASLDSCARVFVKERNMECALCCYEDKLELLQQCSTGNGDPQQRNKDTVDTLCKLGSVCNELSQHDRAIDYYQHAIQTAHSLPQGIDHEEEYIRIITRGLCASYVLAGNHSTALRYHKEYLHMCTFSEKADVLNNMGVLLSTLYKISDALDCYRKAVQILSMSCHGDDDDAENNRETLAWIAKLQGIFLSSKKRPKERDCYEKALDSRDMKTVLVNLGLVQLKKISLSTQSQRLLGDGLLAAGAFGHVCTTFLLEEHGGKQLQRTSPSVASGASSSSSSSASVTNIFKCMGNVLFRRKRYEEAVEYYEKCLFDENSSRHLTRPDRFDLLTNMGMAYLKLGNESISLAHFKRALEELERCHRATVKDMSKENAAANPAANIYAPPMKGHLKALVEREDSYGNFMDIMKTRHLTALALCRMGVYNDSSRLIDVLIKMGDGAFDLNALTVAELIIDLSTVQMLGSTPESAWITFGWGMERVKREKIPLHHPLTSQLRRMYKWHDHKSGGAISKMRISW